MQLDAIKTIRNAGKFASLTDKLKYTAQLREEHPTDTLDQLSSYTDGKDKVSKSGLKHRLDKIIQIAEDIKNNK